MVNLSQLTEKIIKISTFLSISVELVTRNSKIVLLLQSNYEVRNLLAFDVVLFVYQSVSKKKEEDQINSDGGQELFITLRYVYFKKNFKNKKVIFQKIYLKQNKNKKLPQIQLIKTKTNSSLFIKLEPISKERNMSQEQSTPTTSNTLSF